MELVELKKLCSMKSGGTPSRRKPEYYEGNFPWAKISDLEKSADGYVYKTDEYITEEALSSINNRVFEKGTLLLAMYGSVGKTAIAGTKLTTNQAILGLNIIDENILDIIYLKYWFQLTKEILLNRAVGGTLQNISKTIVSNLKIPLPPLPTQKKIASILDEADTLRQLNKQLITKYDALTQSLFLEMFGSLNDDLTELGEVIKLIGGGTPSKDVEEYWNGNIPWASVKDLKSDRLNRTVDRISTEGVNNSATKIIPKGSLIIATRMAVGRVAINEIDVAINQDLKAVKIIGDVNVTYLQGLFKSKENYFDSVSSGATVKGIKIEHITKLKVSIPPIKLQNQFAERVAVIEQQKAQAQQSLQKSEDLFNSLLQKAFKGELLK